VLVARGKTHKNMIRFLNLKDQICEGDSDFAFYNTISCKILSFDGDHAFDSIQDFTEAYKKCNYPENNIDRFLSLIPDGFFERDNSLIQEIGNGIFPNNKKHII
jgi:hypothetical protein